MNRFEQLIEYVINDEEQKARELFHDIVVEKSREIYEDLMSEEAEEVDEAKDEDEDKEEVDEAEDLGEEAVEEAMGGDAADDLIDEIEMEEESEINMEGEGEEEETVDVDVDADDHHADVGGDEELEDRVMDLEDKLDELMAEFEELMGDKEGDGDDFGADEGGDAIEMDDTEEMMPEMGMMEAMDLKAAPKPVTSEEGSVNKKSTVAANSGQAGMAAHPVKTGGEMGGKHDAPGAYSNTTKELGAPSTQEAGKKAFKSAAPKAVTTQAAGVNTRTPFPKG